MFYFALVRPLLECAASILGREHKDLIRRLNKMQRKAALFINNRCEGTHSVTQLIKELGWEPLETRTLHARLLDKFMSDFFQTETAVIMITPQYISRSDKGVKIREINCRTDT
jgi:hypothetical protein